MADHDPLWVLGAGGHAKVVIATARAAGLSSISVADDDPARRGETLLGARIERSVTELLADGNARCVLAIGDNRRRYDLAATARCRFATIVHPTAIVHDSVTLGAGSVVFAGCIIQPDTSIGAHAIVNTGASIDHDCTLGAAVHVCPGSRLAGGVTFGDGVMLGIGAVVIPGCSIGAWTDVGAGAAVVSDLPGYVTAIGVPARVKGPSRRQRSQ
jgi:sugar O-acyltransferase (sialic acid O-acetyltransferase NeuD family)